jgi:transposase InsO family protein
MGWSFCYVQSVSFNPDSYKLLVEEIISRHGVPRELLSDRGVAFLSKLLHEIYSHMGIHKVSTTAYHPQTDGLVERFHRTLTSMLSKTTQPGGLEWDDRLPYVLFAYRCTEQESIRWESPFFMVYGRDPVYLQMKLCWNLQIVATTMLMTTALKCSL